MPKSMSIVTCDCKFRGKDTELVEGKCPRCGNDLSGSKGSGPKKSTGRRTRKAADAG